MIAYAVVDDALSPAVRSFGFLDRTGVPIYPPADQIATWRELLDRGYRQALAFASIEGGDPLEVRRSGR